MRRCVKCAHVVDGPNAVCAACGSSPPAVSPPSPAPNATAGEVTPDVTLPATDPSALPSPFAAAGLNKWHIAGAIVAILGPAAITFALLRGLGPGGDTLPAADQASMLATKRTTGDPSPAAIVSKWTDANSARWVSNRRRSIAFELPAENTASAGLGRVRPVLVVRCLANTTDVFVYTHWPAAMERQDDGRTTHVSFDGEAESTERWLTLSVID